MKKTLSYDVLKDHANAWLKKDHLSDAERKIIFSFVQDVIFRTERKQYEGFNYVDWLESGCDKWHEDDCPENGDKEKYYGNQTKVKFY